MSQRTVVEFNHDYAGEIDRDPEGFVQAVRMLLNSGANGDGPNCRFADLRRFGVTTSPTAHHSCGRKVMLSHERTGRVYHEQEF